MAESGFFLNAITGSYSTDDKTLIVSNPEHRALHKKRAFKLAFTSTATTDGTQFLIQVNGSSNAVMLITSFEAFVSLGFADLRLIKLSTASTHTPGSNQMIPYNKHNGSTEASFTTFFDDPTDVSSTASNNYIADRYQIGSTAGNLPFLTHGSAIAEKEEAFLFDNSTYVIQIDIQTTAANCWFTARMSYFEHNGD